MTREDEIRCEKLLQLMRMENESAARECQHGDGWLYDHAQAIREYSAEIDVLLTQPEQSHSEAPR